MNCENSEEKDQNDYDDEDDDDHFASSEPSQPDPPSPASQPPSANLDINELVGAYGVTTIQAMLWWFRRCYDDSGDV